MKEKKPVVLVTRRFPDSVVSPLQKIAEVLQWDNERDYLMPREKVLEVIGNVTAVINQAELKVDEALLREAGKLKIVANVSIGADNLDLALMAQRGVWASNTPGHFDYPVAEYAIGGIIAVLRRILEADQFVRSGNWRSFQPGLWDGEGLTNKKLGIIGMGSIGKSLARLGSSLGMEVFYYNRSDVSTPYARLSLQELLSVSDVVSVHVPYSAQSHEMIGADELQRMKKGALLVNTSRGKVLDERALIHALVTGHLGGAVLDVFYDEPQVPEALRLLPNVVLSPHVGGGTRSSRIACYQMAVANVKAVLEGEPPVNPLN